MANYRSPVLLKAAEHAPCCMACHRRNDGSVVMAHSNQLRDGKGMGIKAHDYRVAALCGKCHVELDQGKNMSWEERVSMWELAHRETVGWLFSSGLVEVTAGWRP
jgi:hypothetical protein